VFALTATLFGGIIEGQANRQDKSLHTFEHVGMNIFVPVTIAGPGAAPKQSISSSIPARIERQLDQLSFED
jgi:hypothetical protein